MCPRFALDWQLGQGLVMNWQIGGGSVDRSWAGIGLMIWARVDRLTLHWQIGNGLADLHGICRGLA